MPMKTELIKQLTKLVSINSQYPQEKELGEYIIYTLINTGFKVRKQFIDKTRFNVLAEKGTGNTSVLFYAHLDTVSIAQGWKTNPHNLTIVGDKAYGLGAWDMKAGLLANILAVSNSNPKNTKLKLVFCVDEEYISKGGHALIKSSFMKDVACVISTEPAFQHGVQGIVTGRIGRAVYDVKISTKSQHFAMYDPKFDINIVYANFINQIKKLFKKNGDKKQFIFARSVQSTVIGLSIPEKMEFQLDSSVLPPNTADSILKILCAIAKRIEVKNNSTFKVEVVKHPRETPFLEPYVVNARNIYLAALKKSVFAISKKTALPYFRSSVADENIFGAAGFTTLGIGPVGSNAHGANEWVSLSSIKELVSILTHFISLSDEL